jgi:hypothetical protein
MMKSLTLLLTTLIFKNQGAPQKMKNERCAYPPSVSLRSPSGTLRGKTNDESFIQNIQLSPVLMLPSQKPLRDISCFKDFKTLKSKAPQCLRQQKYFVCLSLGQKRERFTSVQLQKN